MGSSCPHRSSSPVPWQCIWSHLKYDERIPGPYYRPSDLQRYRKTRLVSLKLISLKHVTRQVAADFHSLLCFGTIPLPFTLPLIPLLVILFRQPYFARASPWGWIDRGWIQVRQAHLLPNSNFSSDFGHFALKILEILKIW